MSDTEAGRSSWRRGVLWGAIALYVVVILAVMAAFFGIANLDVQRAAYVQGSPVLVPGRAQALRGVILDATTGLPLVGVDVRWVLADRLAEGADPPAALPKDAPVVGHASTGPGGYVHGVLTLPPTTPPSEQGKALWMWAKEGPGGREDPFFAEVPIEVAAAGEQETPWWPGSASSRLPEEARLERSQRQARRVAQGGEVLSPAEMESKGDVRIDVLPEHGELPRGLPSTIYVRTRDRASGKPVATRLWLVRRSGLFKGKPFARLVETDELGLAALKVTPASDLSLTWAVLSAEEEVPEPGGELGAWPVGVEGVRSEARWALRTVPSQFSLVLRDRVLSPQEELEGYVFSLYRSQGFMADLYEGDRWVQARAFGLGKRGSGLRLQPESSTGAMRLVRVQVYRDIYETGNGWDVGYAVVGEGTPEEALRWLSGRLAERHKGAWWKALALAMAEGRASTVDEARQRLWLGAMLAGVAPRFRRPPVLANTQKADRERLERWKDEVQEQLVVLMTLLLAVGGAVLALVVLVLMQRASLHRAALEEVELEFGDPEALPSRQRAARLQRLASAIQGAVILGTLLAFGYGLIVLLRYM